MTSDSHFLPSGSAAADGFDVAVTPESAGWGYSGLRVLTLPAGGQRTLDTGPDEMFVVPLAGSADVECAGQTFALEGRPDVFAGPSDFAYVPIDSRVTVHSANGGRFALASARTDRAFSFRYGARADVAVEFRGAGQCSREVRNFGTADAFEAGAVIACEVVTPGGNWSSYPAHKHDEQSDTEAELEEIYYFEIADGPAGQPGFGIHRTFTSAAGQIDVLAEVHNGDTALVPYGWHGPCIAGPGFDMYYLNVMAGPGQERAWLISDHPDHAWVREQWQHEPIDSRLTEGAS